jgi:hypothetical protein
LNCIYSSDDLQFANIDSNNNLHQVRGRDRTWHYEGNGMTAGKQPFMASAVEELVRKAGSDVEIQRCTTLLIDDDPDNIRIALNDGVRGILFNPRCSQIHLLDVLQAMP